MTTGWIDIIIVGDTRGVEEMLAWLDTSLSGPGLVAFLNGKVGPWLHERAEARFRNEGDDVTGPWAPLKPATQRIRASKGFPPAHPINIRTGEMERYILGGTFQAAIPGQGGAVLSFPGSGQGGSKELREKMRTAQQGKTQPNTVARPVLGMNEKDLEFVLFELASHIQRGGTP